MGSHGKTVWCCHPTQRFYLNKNACAYLRLRVQKTPNIVNDPHCDSLAQLLLLLLHWKL